MPSEVSAFYAQQVARAASAEAQWEAAFAQYAAQHPDLAAQFARRMKGELPADEEWVDKLPANPTAVSVVAASSLMFRCTVHTVYSSTVFLRLKREKQ